MEKKVAIFLLMLCLCVALGGLMACGRNDSDNPQLPNGNITDSQKPNDDGNGGEAPNPPVVHAHLMTHHEANEATCVDAGNVEYWNCSECGKSYTDKGGSNELSTTIILAKGHTEVTDTAIEATCTTVGKTEGTHCSVCSEILVSQTEVPAKGHSYSEAWNDDGMHHWHECADCKEKDDYAEHDFANGDCVCGIAKFSQGLKYTFLEESDSYEVSGIGTCTDTDIIISAVYDGKFVKSIGNSAFYRCGNLKSVTIPNSVTSIGQYAFYECLNLTSVLIPNSVTSIGNSTFSGCSNLISVTIPNVTSIGIGVFWRCSSLTSITIPNSVTSIGGGAFRDCSSLTSVIIPNSVTRIEKYAFEECRSLTNIEIPNSVTSIGGGVFRGCSSLTSIYIPNSVTSIEFCAFEECSNLTIYCKAAEKPSGWSSDWNPSDRPVVWGYKG